MSGSDGVDPPAYPDLNPFSMSAVARVAEFDEERSVVTIETDAIQTALAALHAFVSVPLGEPEEREGAVIALIGDYGTGKTHLSNRLLREAQEMSRSTVRGMYVDATTDGFLAVYQRFISKLTLGELRSQVKAYYSEIVLDSLLGTEVSEDVQRRLRESDFDPVVAVDRFALMEASLLRQLKDSLHRVTGNDEYGTALMLLLRQGFEDSVWSWLQGGKPDQILVERGVHTWIREDVPALEAMGVIATLFGRKEHRFILVLDELDKVLSSAANPRRPTVDAFKELLRMFTAAGALLVLAGLPDILLVVGTDVTERISQVIPMMPLDAPQTMQFIEDSIEATLGVRRAWPFTQEAVDYIVRITRGVPRQIIRLCYHAYRRAADDGTEVEAELVRQIAMDQFYLASRGEVRTVIRQVLDRNGLAYLGDENIGSVAVDYWIPIGRSGCGVIVAGSVLSQEEVDALRHDAQAIEQQAPDKALLLVVEGYIAEEYATELENLFEILHYDALTFPDRLAAALSALVQRIERLASVDPVEAVRERVEQIARLQANLQLTLEDWGARVDEVWSASDKRLQALQEQVRAMARRMPEGLRVPEITITEQSTEIVAQLPAEVSRLFADALSGVAELDRFDDLLGRAFGTQEDSSPDPTTRGHIRSRLKSADSSQAAGVAVLFRKSIDAFQRGIETWYYRYERLRSVDEERLDQLCLTYDTVVESLPIARLSAVSDLVDSGNRLASTLRQAQQREVFRTRELLESLSVRVRQAVLRSVQD